MVGTRAFLHASCGWRVNRMERLTYEGSVNRKQRDRKSAQNPGFFGPASPHCYLFSSRNLQATPPLPPPLPLLPLYACTYQSTRCNCLYYYYYYFRLVVVGGGSGGCGTANKFASKVGKGKVRLRIFCIFANCGCN